MGQYQAERAAIEGQFKTTWGAEAVPLKWENDKTSTPNNAPYVTFTLLTGEGQFASVSSRPRRRYEGLVVVRIYTPEGTGNKESNRLLELAESAFLTSDGVGRQVESGAGGFITFRLPSREGAGIAGGFYMTILRVPYYRDQQGA